MPDYPNTLDIDTSFGADLEEKKTLWAPYYEHVFALMGGVGGSAVVIVPLGDTHHELGDRTGGTLFGGSENAYTYPEAVTAFDTPPYFKGRCGIPIITLNGVDEYISTPDASFWTRGDGSDDSPFTLRVWATIPDNAARRSLFTKYNDDGEKEWALMVVGTDELRGFVCDKVVGVRCFVESDVNPIWNALTCFHFVYSGVGGAAAGNGIDLYQNGVLMSTTVDNNGTYVAMSNSITRVEIGRNVGATPGYLDGEIAGGPLGPAFGYNAMSPDLVKRQYHLERAALSL